MCVCVVVSKCTVDAEQPATPRSSSPTWLPEHGQPDPEPSGRLEDFSEENGRPQGQKLQILKSALPNRRLTLAGVHVCRPCPHTQNFPSAFQSPAPNTRRYLRPSRNPKKVSTMENRAKTNWGWGWEASSEEVSLCRDKETKNKQKFVTHTLRAILYP